MAYERDFEHGSDGFRSEHIESRAGPPLQGAVFRGASDERCRGNLRCLLFGTFVLEMCEKAGDIMDPEDPAGPFERKYDWGMMTRGLSTFSDSVFLINRFKHYPMNIDH